MRTVVGAYATAPRPIESDAQFRRYTDAVFALPGVDGLEIPFFESESPWNSLDYLREAPSSSRHVLTLVPAMVVGMSERPTLGLASNDEDARQAAVAIVRRALEFTDSVNSAGGGLIDTVELHSTPRRSDGSLDAFERSLDEIASWQWGSRRLTVEHCDTDTGTHPPAKGYLRLDEELRAVTARNMGMIINWGRSVIETRSSSGALEHIETVASAGALGGVVFSGCSPVDTVYGQAWGDLHVPIRGWSASSRLANDAESSLLDPEELQRCVTAALRAPELGFLGVKVAPPPSATDEERVELLAANLAILTAGTAAARASE